MKVKRDKLESKLSWKRTQGPLTLFIPKKAWRCNEIVMSKVHDIRIGIVNLMLERIMIVINYGAVTIKEYLISDICKICADSL